MPGAGRARCVTRGQDVLARFDDVARRQVRTFCSRCGTPVMFTRASSPKWVNIPRALFTERTGREPKYHVAIDQLQDWAYLGAPVGPLKGYPGVVHQQRIAAVLLDQVSRVTAVGRARDGRAVHCALEPVREHLSNDTLDRVAIPGPDNADAGRV